MQFILILLQTLSMKYFQFYEQQVHFKRWMLCPRGLDIVYRYYDLYSFYQYHCAQIYAFTVLRNVGSGKIVIAKGYVNEQRNIFGRGLLHWQLVACKIRTVFIRIDTMTYLST